MECSLFQSNKVKCAGVYAFSGNPLMTGLNLNYWTDPFLTELAARPYNWTRKNMAKHIGTSWAVCWKKSTAYCFGEFYDLRTIRTWSKPKHIEYYSQWPRPFQSFWPSEPVVCRYFGRTYHPRKEFHFPFFVNPFRQRYNYTDYFWGGVDFRNKLFGMWERIEHVISEIHTQMSGTLAIELDQDDFGSSGQYRPDFDDPMSGPFTIEELSAGFWGDDDNGNVWWTPPRNFVRPELWDSDPDIHRDYVVHQQLSYITG